MLFFYNSFPIECSIQAHGPYPTAGLGILRPVWTFDTVRIRIFNNQWEYNIASKQSSM